MKCIPQTLHDAKKELENAEQVCEQWHKELAEHPEYLKSDSIAETDRKTKKLCEVAIKDASLDVEAVQIRENKKAEQQQQQNSQAQPDYGWRYSSGTKKVCIDLGTGAGGVGTLDTQITSFEDVEKIYPNAKTVECPQANQATSK